eukprot:TRINITY_DN1881_c0_g1_i1.p1 TRINITY_DN1881_c0_g1~~TRINITY_DN1881_c0_g1_i1.p1  ORF type:complete len:388 (+),score=76.70 TRINITY_DN1881_c0_g1_i1:69-1232(+)
MISMQRSCGMGIGKLGQCGFTAFQRQHCSHLFSIKNWKRSYSSSTTPSTSTPTKIFSSTTNDPIFNLATEDWLLKDSPYPLTHPTLFLWRNSPTVVIGRYQNPWKECHVQKMEEDNVTLARRQSGGGAVYQDLGNTCFTFISNNSVYSKETNSEIIIQALKKFGISAVASGRNDILVDGLKISGSAYKKSAQKSFHHGTLLINVDMNALQKYLNPNILKLKSKGVSSVVARVVNLSTLNTNITHDTLSQAIIDTFKEHYNDKDSKVENLDQQTLSQIPSLAESYNSLKDWNWRYGATPAFEINFETRFDWGIIDVHINCSEGVISEIKIFSDSLFPLMIEEITSSLKGAPYNKKGVYDALEKSRQKFQSTECEGVIVEMRDWMIKHL